MPQLQRFRNYISMENVNLEQWLRTPKLKSRFQLCTNCTEFKKFLAEHAYAFVNAIDRQVNVGIGNAAIARLRLSTRAMCMLA